MNQGKRGKKDNDSANANIFPPRIEINTMSVWTTRKAKL